MSRNGQTVRYRGAPKYNGLFGKPSYIEFAEIASPTPIEWQVGDYVDYTRTGFRYKLYTIPQVVKSATSGTAGDAFVYKNVQFFCATKDLEIALFRDIVEYDNGMHFSSIPNVDTYEDVYGIINRIQANMDDFAPGQWTIRAMSTSYSEITNLMSEVRAFSLADGTCMDALNQIYALWKGLSWIYKVENGRHTIVIGRPNLQDASNTTPEFSYGEDCGLKVITRAVSTKNEMATRIYAYGSDRNLPTRYYNNLEPHILNYESVYIPHLMLPLSTWGYTGGQKDARKAYIQSTTAINNYGLIPKIMRFDGTGDLEEIYPSVEGMQIYQVADNDFPSTGYDPYERVDEILDAVNPADDGMYTEDSVKLKQDAITLLVSEIENTYTTLENQEALTIGNESPIFDTETVYQMMNGTGTEEGRFVIKMRKLKGTISCTEESGMELASFLMDVPKVYVDVYVGANLISATEAKVTLKRSQVAHDTVNFVCEDIKFTTNAVGYVKIFIRCEMQLAPNSPALSIAYHLAEPSLEPDLEENKVTASVEYTIDTTFKLTLKQIGFDLNAMGSSQLTDGLCTISMRSGLCAGRDFVVEKCVYNEEENWWELTCKRQDDTTLMQYFPNSVYTINTDDRFVLLDLQMPNKYVTAAMSRLHDAAWDALNRLCKPVMAYVPEVDSKAVFMATVTLVEGLYMPVYDPDLIETQIVSEPNVNWILIDTVTIAENEDVIPIYAVTLRDEKVDSMLQIITGELNETNKRLRDKETDESRVPAQPDPEAILVPIIVGVHIEADSKLFVADDEGNYNGQTITLTAVTSGINGPEYQWYYAEETVVPAEEEGEEDEVVVTWVELQDETFQAYLVDAESEDYYPEGKTYADFKVVVTDGASTPTPEEESEDDPEPVTYEDTIRIFKGGRGPKGDPGDPGEDGWSKATITLYRRLSTGDIKDYRISDSIYTFSTQTLTVVSGGTLNGWVSNPDDLQGSGPIYVTAVNVASQDDTVEIRGGWTTDNTVAHPQGDWSEPVRWTGENGLIGKVMRGVNEFNPYGIGGEDAQHLGADYQGRTDVDPSHIYYDVVKYNDTYYYCEHDKALDGVTLARQVTPGTNSYVWVEATNFDFIATNVLLADNAFIDVGSGNAFYMYDNSGSGGASPNIVAGIQGGSTTIWPPGSGTVVNQVNFFAGTQYSPGDDTEENYDPNDDEKVYPQTAPFRVDYEGNVYMESGQVGVYQLTNKGLTATYRNPYNHATYNYDGVHLEVDGLQPAPWSGEVDISASAGCTFTYTDSYSNVSTTFISGGIIQRNGEDAITFNSDSAASNLGAILHVVHCTQSRYDYLEANNQLDANTFYVITTS